MFISLMGKRRQSRDQFAADRMALHRKFVNMHERRRSSENQVSDRLNLSDFCPSPPRLSALQADYILQVSTREKYDRTMSG
jgi:hypothetical protein